MTSVAIVQPYVPEYRVAFFTALRDRLHDSGVSLVLAHGDPPSGLAARNDSVALPWAQLLHTKTLRAAGRTLRWRQLADLPPADLVILEQAVGSLESLAPLLRLRRLRQRPIALWGHGRTRSHIPAPGEVALKRAMTNRSDWFFAYTASGARHVVDHGFPQDRVTVVENSIAYVPPSQIAQTSVEEIARFRETHGISEGPVGVYIGGLDASKRLHFLMNAAQRIASATPGFQLVIGGDGASRQVVETTQAPWLRYVGRVGDKEKAVLSHLGSLMLVPGAVGLVAVDSFALQLPIVTTEWPNHGPEFDYLEHDVNAWITCDDPAVYAAAAASLLRDVDRLKSLTRGCHESAERYTLNNMVTRFVGGIHSALARGVP